MVKNGSKWSKMVKIAKNGKGPPARSRGPETSMLYIILQEKNIATGETSQALTSLTTLTSKMFITI